MTPPRNDFLRTADEQQQLCAASAEMFSRLDPESRALRITGTIPHPGAPKYFSTKTLPLGVLANMTRNRTIADHALAADVAGLFAVSIASMSASIGSLRLPSLGLRN